MKALKIGAATEEPVSRRPSGVGLSKPTNTPTARSGENPMNQVSRLSFVVPVFPASGQVSALMRRYIPAAVVPKLEAIATTGYNERIYVRGDANADYGTEREPDNARDDDCCQADPQRETNDLEEIAVASRADDRRRGSAAERGAMREPLLALFLHQAEHLCRRALLPLVEAHVLIDVVDVNGAVLSIDRRLLHRLIRHHPE